MTFPHLAALFPGWRKSSSAAQLRLAIAYRNVFSREEGRIVLADLANRTGFFRVNGPDIPSDQRAFADGMRAVYGSILPILNLSDTDLAALAEAARQEAIADAQRDDFT